MSSNSWLHPILKPGIFLASSLGAGILYSLLASETNEYFDDDNTATSWMSAVLVMSILLTFVQITDGCGQSIYSGNKLVIASLVSVVVNGILAFWYFGLRMGNPGFKKRNFFIFAAVTQFLILVSGFFLHLRTTTGPKTSSNAVYAPVNRQQPGIDLYGKGIRLPG